MYVQGFVLGVKEDGQQEYLKVARTMGQMFIDFGALEATENWEADVPDGEVTDFRKAVAAQPGEKIVFHGSSGPTSRPATKARLP